VFVSRGDGKFEPREVKVGVESEDGYVQVISGLLDQEQVVVSGQFLLDSESRTREAIAKMRAVRTQKNQTAAKDEGESTAESQEIKHRLESHAHETPELDADQLYACPMHPHFITTDPDARCPECGMSLVPIEELGDKVDLEKAEFYTCPMHPEFLTTDKDARCPECGMKLEKVK
jgi:rubrerythrin